jgi:hypothetical protein
LRRRAAAEHLAGAGLVEADGLAGAPLHVADGLEQAQDAEAVDVGGVLGLLEADGDVGLGAEVVDLVGEDGSRGSRRRPVPSLRSA